MNKHFHASVGLICPFPHHRSYYSLWPLKVQVLFLVRPTQKFLHNKLVTGCVTLLTKVMRINPTKYCYVVVELDMMLADSLKNGKGMNQPSLPPKVTSETMDTVRCLFLVLMLWLSQYFYLSLRNCFYTCCDRHTKQMEKYFSRNSADVISTK